MPRRVLTRPALGCRETHCATAVVWTAPLSPCTWTCFARMAWAFLSQQEPHHTLHFNLFPSISVANMWEADEYKEACPTIPCPEVLPLN